MDITPLEKAPPSAQAGPGVLRNKASLTLQTRPAQSLVQGRSRDSGKPAIIGLDGFSRFATQICNSAAADDPYADLALLQIEAALADSQKTIRGNIGVITPVLDSMPAVEIELAQSVDPAHVPLMFATPYGYLGAYLLADYDELVRTVLTARHCAIIDRERAFRLLIQSGRPIRRTFCLPHIAWRYTGVTRQDIMENRKLAQQAKAIYESLKIDDIPADVLQGIKRGRFAPAFRKAPVPAAATYLEEEEE